MKTLHLLKTSIGARWALLQIRELVLLGLECHVVLPSANGLAPQYSAAGATVHVVDLNAAPLTPKFFGAAAALRELVAAVNPHVVHSHFVATTLLMRYALRGLTCARVFQVPGPLHLENRLSAGVELAVAGANDYWIASCQWTRLRYRALGVSADRVFLSHYGSDLGDAGRVARGALRTELGLAATTRLVGMVAYCYKPKAYLGARRGIKGHEDFIDAVGLLRRGGRDVVGVIAGGAWSGAERYYASVRKYAGANSDARVVFLGTRRDISSIYGDLDVAAHPSLSENLGGAAESMLLGVPTVTTSVGGFPDLISDGVTGRMVPPRDPARLAAAMQDLLENRSQAEAIALAGQKHARALLDVRSTAREVAAIYARIAQSRSHASVPAAAGAYSEAVR